MTTRTISIDLLANDKMGRAFREAAGDVGKLKKTFDQSGVAAGSFSKQLGDLERQERATARQNAIVESTMKRLARAQQEAADASDRLERGEIDAAEATRLQEHAEKLLNKVLVAQAAASRAAAQEADNLAQEQREAARAAELAAAKTRLAHLKAVGAVKEHNLLLNHLRAKYPDLGKAGEGAFKEITVAAKRSTLALRSMSGVGIAGAAIALGSLPWLATAAGTAITLGVGGALVGVGIVSAAQSEKVKKEFTGLRKHVVAEVKDMSKPFEDTLVKSAGFLQDAFDELAPTLRKELADLAPVVTDFAGDFARSLTQLKPAIRDVSKAFGPLLSELGNRLPALMGRVADAISRIARSADPEMFGRFIEGIGLLVTGAGHAVAALTKLADIFYRFGPIAIAARNIDDFASGLRNFSVGSDLAKRATEGYSGALTSANTGAVRAIASTLNLATQTGHASGSFNKMTGTMRLASQTANQLKASLDALSGKTLNLREATSAYEEAVDNASAALKANGKAHGFATDKSRTNEAALDSLAKTAHSQAVAMRDSGKGAVEVARFMENARKKFISTALGMGKSRAEAKSLANQLFGLKNAANAIPKARSTKITTPGIGNAIRASKDMRRAVLNVPTSRTITYYVRNQGNAIRASKQMRTGGYIDGYATGGEIRGYPAGGMIRGVGGPTSDSNLIAASKGEFMINAASTKQFRPLLEAINSGRAPQVTRARKGSVIPRPRGATPVATRPQEVVVKFESDGSKAGDFIVELVRKSVRVRGGNVQTVLGRG